ncbi:hypothetical protein M501DRAFT_246652 [Patellaria atrata CBS 101060]|uniref:Uncharacterized protein n=1 Tax=Patellaria atrata CBS 101060 TaxID=1346257 RepID=A0A9P4S5G7_9PEZI|nr:hypothetical protein M501DRAFT_246652 [Patellaria atrata CBS 101060]
MYILPSLFLPVDETTTMALDPPSLTYNLGKRKRTIALDEPKAEKAQKTNTPFGVEHLEGNWNERQEHVLRDLTAMSNAGNINVELAQPTMTRRHTHPVHRPLAASRKRKLHLVQSVPEQNHTSSAPGRCHICARPQRLKRDLLAYADCARCAGRTCFVCLRVCEGDDTNQGNGLGHVGATAFDDMGKHVGLGQGYRNELGGCGMPEPGRGGESADHGCGGRKVCSQCCVEVGQEGRNVCLDCLGRCHGERMGE